MIAEEQRLQKDKVRVFELARELDLESKDLMALCRNHGIELKNQLSNVTTEQRDQIIDLVKRGPTAAAQPQRATAPVIPAVINRKVQSLDTRRPTAGKPAVPPSVPKAPDSGAAAPKPQDQDALAPAATLPPTLPAVETPAGAPLPSTPLPVSAGQPASVEAVATPKPVDSAPSAPSAPASTEAPAVLPDVAATVRTPPPPG